MPTYNFNCIHCDNAIGITAPITSTISPPICAKCGAVMIRSYEFGGIELKGSGFYSTEGRS